MNGQSFKNIKHTEYLNAEYKDIYEKILVKNEAAEPELLAKLQNDERLKILQEVFEGDEQFKNEQRAKIAYIKQNTPDKEIFGIQKFGEFYNLRGDDGELLITPEIIEEYEVEYYLKNPNLKSLQEYADYRKNLDRQEAN